MEKRTKNKINNRIFIYFTFASCIVILLVTFFFVNSFSRAIRLEGVRITSNTLDRSGKNLERYINQVKELSLILENTPVVKSFFNSGTVSEAKQAEIEKLLMDVVMIKPDLVSIVFVGRDGRLVSNVKDLPMALSGDMMDMPWYKETLNNGGQPVLTSARMQDFSANKDTWVISMCREIKAADGTNLGMILIDLNYSVIEDVLGNLDLGKNGYVYVINDKGQPVYHEDVSYFTDSKKAATLLKEAHAQSDSNGKSVTSSYHLTNADWLVVANTSLDSMRMIQDDIVHAVIISTIALAILASISSFRIKQLMGDIKRKEQVLRETELSALQNQINPHFLYNSLDTIIWMAEFKKIEKVIAITSALARFFRLSLSSSGITSFGNELEHVKQYLQIQSYRYENLLTYEIDVDESLMNWKVPKLILQPIVENAIDHGIRGKKEGGVVKISASVNRDRLEIIVADDGVGFACEKNYALPTDAMLKGDVFQQEKDSVHTKKRSSGVGLKNVAMRVYLFGGEDCGVMIDSTLNVGTTVKLMVRNVNTKGAVAG